MNIKFKYHESSVYEMPNRLRSKLARIAKWKIFDWMGIFQVIKTDNDADYYFSYNRFLKTDKPYVIYLENPAALMNYSWDRPKCLITKMKIKKYLSDKNLKYIICMSKACEKYFYNLYDVPDSNKILQLYPFIPNSNISIDKVHAKAANDTVEMLFVSSNFLLKGGRDILMVACHLDKKFHLTIITRIDSINEADMAVIKQLKCISLVDFKLSKSELDEYYKKAAILLNPTRYDSFNLVTLEAIKFGIAILATDMFALNEMVKDGENGYLTKPMFKVWDEDGSENKYMRKHYNETVASGKLDKELIKWMIKHLSELIENRELLTKFCINSLNMSRNSEFSSESLSSKWESLITHSVERSD